MTQVYPTDRAVDRGATSCRIPPGATASYNKGMFAGATTTRYVITLTIASLVTIALPAFGHGAGDGASTTDPAPSATSASRSAQSANDKSGSIINLSEITVKARALPSLVTPSLDKARKRLARVPGGTTLIDADTYRDRAVRSLEDVLAFAPGVFVQSRYGNGETRTSIRGSGISLTYGVRGILFLRDGLPLNSADGFFNPELVNPLTARYVEVYRGANALQYGAATLGGAINFVSATGYTAPAARVRLGVGSDGYVHPQATFGKVFGHGWDAFGSVSALHQDGFRNHSKDVARQVYANVGYRYSDNVQSRLHVNIRHSRLELPGPLTQAQIAADPSQASPVYSHAGAFRHIDARRFTLQTAVRVNPHNQLKVGIFYQDSSLHHPLPFFVLDQDSVDTGISFRQRLEGRLAGHANRVIVGARLARGTNDFKRFAPAGHARSGPLRLAGEKTAVSGDIFAENRFRITDTAAFVAGAQLAYATRRSDIRFGSRPDTDQHYTGFSPRIGATWQVAPVVQLYGNLSRSFEPPTFQQLRNPVTGILAAQTATTLEFGARNQHGNFKWQADVYRSWLDDEILTTETPVGSGNFVTNNAAHTLHTGLELGVEERLSLDWFGHDHLRLRATYTYNLFRFENDAAFGDNRIPGIPPHFGRLELLYERPDGFYIGPTLGAASHYYVDYANTLETASYIVFGARAGYNKGNFSVFIEACNLADRHYASNTSLVADAHGHDKAVFNPGIGRSVFVGMEVKW